MKRIAFLLILAMMTIISCAKEKEKKSAESQFSADPYQANTLNGYFNPANTQAPIEVGTCIYSISSQTNPQIINQALQQAQQSRVSPLMSNGVAKFQARITGFVNNLQYMQPNQYNQTQPVYNQPPADCRTQQKVLTITALQFY